MKGNPGPAGAGGLIRDENENWVVGFSLNLGVCNSFVAEQCAILKGLEIAWEQATYHRVVQFCFWPGLRQDIHEMVSSCKRCQKNKTESVPPATIAYTNSSMDSGVNGFH